VDTLVLGGAVGLLQAMAVEGQVAQGVVEGS
jgi:hypothetical protein